MEQVLSIDTIVSNPEIRSGRPVIKGTGLTVSTLVAYHANGMPPEELAEQFELSLGEVYAALAYYHMHKDEIEAEIEENDQGAEELRKRLTR
ncbi:MAG: DUF433 domain-containing protein [Anaerolineae bacterium]|nr:DUF433 domain-containing protein [Anaerolineae bacterium]